MTGVKNIPSSLKSQRFHIELIPEGRKIYFEKECLEPVSVLRKVNAGNWEVIAKQVRTPHFDTAKIKGPSTLEYKLVFEDKTETDSVKVNLFE